MKKYSIAIVLGIVILSFLINYFISSNYTNKIAYVQLATVYDEFPMKKELESNLMKVQNARKIILDSLQIQLNSLSLSVKSEKDIDAIRLFQVKKQEYLIKQQNFEEDNELMTQNYTSQIWKQINQYVKDYGTQNEYTFILGADGSGNLMYSDDKKDITKEVSLYINERYAGEKK